MDAVCESIEICFKKLKQLESPQYFETWFIRIVINQCKMQLRKRKKLEGVVELLQNQSQGEEEVNNFTSNQNLEKLREKVSSLSELDRKILYMRFWMNCRLKEISNNLNIPLSTVKTRLYSGLKKLKHEMNMEASNDER